MHATVAALENLESKNAMELQLCPHYRGQLLALMREIKLGVFSRTFKQQQVARLEMIQLPEP